MIWGPICLGAFKLTVLGATVFLSLKSHRDGEREQKRQREEGRQPAPAEPALPASGTGNR